MALLTPISAYIEKYKIKDFDQITAERKSLLEEFASKITSMEGKIQLTFICTHNSRRSHLSQIWAQTAASFYGIENVYCYSGGTEATAFNPRAVKAIQDAGFKVEYDNGSENPEYLVAFAEDQPALKCFSKTYDDVFNPQSDFLAIMTCDSANEACPVVIGAKAKIAILYRDPKEADGTPEETARYAERCEQIGREMFYAFSKLKNIKHG